MNPTKRMVEILLPILVALLLVVWIMRFERKEIIDTYKYGLTAATRDATLNLYGTKEENSINGSYEGYEKLETELVVDFQQSMKRFYNTLWYNLGIYGDETKQRAVKMNIPVKGIVGNTALYLCTWDDQWMPPVPYSKGIGDVVYRFTLGDEVLYFDTVTNTRGTMDLNAFPVPWPGVTPEQYRDQLIMEIINKELTAFASSEYNLYAYNMKKGVKFQLPLFDYGEVDGRKVYNSRGNSIEKPGFFAMMDGLRIGINRKPIRLIAFGGAQLWLDDEE